MVIKYELVSEPILSYLDRDRGVEYKNVKKLRRFKI